MCRSLNCIDLFYIRLFITLILKVIVSQTNPFTWDDSASLINSQILNLEFTTERKSLTVSNLSEPVTIDIKSNYTPTVQQITAIDTAVYKHEINITSRESSMQIIIRAPNGTELEVFGKMGTTATPENYDFTVTVPRDLDNETFAATSGGDLQDELKHTVIVPSDLIRNTSVGDVLYLSIRKWGKLRVLI